MINKSEESSSQQAVVKRTQFPHMDAETYLNRYSLSLNDRHSYWSARAEEFLEWIVMPKDVEQVQHRLQKVDNPGQPLVLDDAYNSEQSSIA